MKPFVFLLALIVMTAAVLGVTVRAVAKLRDELVSNLREHTYARA